MNNSNKKCEGYTGKIKNSSGMVVEPVFKQDGGKSPVVRKGGDLRSGS